MTGTDIEKTQDLTEQQIIAAYAEASGMSNKEIAAAAGYGGARPENMITQLRSRSKAYVDFVAELKAADEAQLHPGITTTKIVNLEANRRGIKKLLDLLEAKLEGSEEPNIAVQLKAAEILSKLPVAVTTAGGAVALEGGGFGPARGAVKIEVTLKREDFDVIDQEPVEDAEIVPAELTPGE